MNKSLAYGFWLSLVGIMTGVPIITVPCIILFVGICAYVTLTTAA